VNGCVHTGIIYQSGTCVVLRFRLRAVGRLPDMDSPLLPAKRERAPWNNPHVGPHP
jgi:hypothetical protein